MKTIKKLLIKAAEKKIKVKTAIKAGRGEAT